MSAKELEQQLLLDAHEAGFTVINGLIYNPSACERMAAFQALKIIWENRIINGLPAAPAQTAANAKAVE